MNQTNDREQLPSPIHSSSTPIHLSVCLSSLQIAALVFASCSVPCVLFRLFFLSLCLCYLSSHPPFLLRISFFLFSLFFFFSFLSLSPSSIFSSLFPFRPFHPFHLSVPTSFFLKTSPSYHLSLQYPPSILHSIHSLPLLFLSLPFPPTFPLIKSILFRFSTPITPLLPFPLPFPYLYPSLTPAHPPSHTQTHTHTHTYIHASTYTSTHSYTRQPRNLTPHCSLTAPPLPLSLSLLRLQRKVISTAPQRTKRTPPHTLTQKKEG